MADARRERQVPAVETWAPRRAAPTQHPLRVDAQRERRVPAVEIWAPHRAAAAPALYLWEHEIGHLELRALRYRVRIQVIKGQDWRTPSSSSDDDDADDEDDDSDDLDWFQAFSVTNIVVPLPGHAVSGQAAHPPAMLRHRRMVAIPILQSKLASSNARQRAGNAVSVVKHLEATVVTSSC